MASVIQSLRTLISGTAEVGSTAMQIGTTALSAGLEATEAWKADRAEVLQASAYSRRLNLLERIKEDARRASQQGIDPRQVMTLTFQDCLAVAVQDLEARKNSIKFERLD